jgi:hypothetical protein
MVKYVSWFFMDFYLELIVCGLNLKVIQIQTKSKPNFKTIWKS